MARFFKTTFLIFTIALTALLAASCSDRNDEPGPEPVKTAQRTILVYIVATNNLGQNGYDNLDIEEMKQGMKKLNDATDARLLVYHAGYTGKPSLKEVTAAGDVVTLKHYDDNALSVSISRMRQVLADMKEFAAAPSYGLVLWSHGTGWIEENSSYDDPDATANTAPLSFGYDSNGRRMKVTALGQALDGTTFDFIYFDCCLMGSVEVAYELRHHARRIVATCTELPLEGMPYDDNIPLLFNDSENCTVDAAASTYRYYCSDKASENSIAIGVYNTAALDRLAAATRAIMETGVYPANGYTGIPYFRTWVTPTGAYDMGHYIRSLSIDAQSLQQWDNAYAEVIVYNAATPKSYGLDMTGFTGMGCNIFTSATDSRLGYGYRNLQWWTDVVSHHPDIN